jgi:hypothetical protein
MFNYQAIATQLKTEVEKIKSVDEWASVLFVVVIGKGSRFVSKKVGVMSEQIEVQHQGHSLSIPAVPGVYEVEAPHISWGSKLFIAYNGEKATIVGTGTAPKTFDYSAFDYRAGRVVENNFVKLGR